MMIAKKHITPDKRLLLAVCDSDIIGKVFEQGDRILDLSSSFYAGDEYTDDEIESLMKKSYMLNLAGRKSVDLAKRLGYVNNSIEIDGIPHAQALTVAED